MKAVGKACFPCLRQCPNSHATDSLAFFTPCHIPLNTPTQKRKTEVLENCSHPVGGKICVFLPGSLGWHWKKQLPVLSSFDQPQSVVLPSQQK